MIRPTLRAVLAFSAGIPAALLLVVYDTALWPFSFDWSALVLLAMAADALLGLPKRLVKVEVTVPERLYIGERSALRSAITSPSWNRPTRFELLADCRGDTDPPEIVDATLTPAAGGTCELPLVPRRRGRVSVERLWLRWRGPLGLVQHVHAIAVGRTVEVVPNVRGAQRAALQFYAREAIYGVKVQRQRGEGAEFEALRDYTPGLDSRFIDWKHSARHRKLVCKEFQAERNHQVVLAFDTGYLMREPIEGIPRLDHAINAGLLLAWISLQGGDLVGVYGFDALVRHYLQPVRGISGFSRIQQATTELEYRSEETNYTLGLATLTARLKRRALVVLFTDFVDTVTAELLVESLRRMTARHVVVFVTLRDSLMRQTVDAPPGGFEDAARAVVAYDLLRDRSIVFERLERLGVHCLDVASGRLSVGLINRYLLIKERGLI